jgi:hypothetical protein
MKKSPSDRKFWDNEARLKALGKGMNSPFKMADLSGDGKVTKKDVLIGRGVIDKNGSPLKASCWPGYEAKGKKKSPSGKKTKGGNTKMVNNCVKK